MINIDYQILVLTIVIIVVSWNDGHKHIRQEIHHNNLIIIIITNRH